MSVPVAVGQVRLRTAISVYFTLLLHYQRVDVLGGVDAADDCESDTVSRYVSTVDRHHRGQDHGTAYGRRAVTNHRNHRLHTNLFTSSTASYHHAW